MTERERYEPPVPGETGRRSPATATPREQHAIAHRVQRAAKRMLRDKYPQEYAAFLQSQPRVDDDGKPFSQYTAERRALSQLAYRHREEAAELRAEVWEEIRASE
jgi:hypothetical protein